MKTAKGTFESPVSEDTNDGERVSYSLREKPEPKKKGKGYKVFALGTDGKLYPPMVANPKGAATPVGVWLDADAAPVAGESKTGRPQVKSGGKGTQGGSGKLAYRPGWHLGEIPYALQFNRKDAEGNRTLFPKNFVFAEVEYAADKNYQDEAHAEGINANGKYQHSLAGLKHLPTDGYYKYRTNPNPETDPWIITGAMKVTRLLTRAEQAELVEKAGREPQKIQDGDVVTDDVVNGINQEIESAPKFSLKNQPQSLSERVKQYDAENGTELKRFLSFLGRGRVLLKGESTMFNVGKSSGILEEHGIKGDIYVSTKTVNPHRHTQDLDHGLTENEWMDALESIKTPLAITKYGDSANSFRIYTYAKKNGKSVCLGVDVNTLGNGVEITNVTNIKTAFGRDIEKAIRNEEIIYPKGEDAIKQIRRNLAQFSPAPNPQVYEQSSVSAANVANSSETSKQSEEKFSIKSDEAADKEVSEMKKVAGTPLVSTDGLVMSPYAAKLKVTSGYRTPMERGEFNDDAEKYSLKTLPSTLKYYGTLEKAKKSAEKALDGWLTRLSMNDEVAEIIRERGDQMEPSGKTPLGNSPIRKQGDIYGFSFDVDTSCPRTFVNLTCVREAEKRLGRPLTLKESIQLNEHLRAYGLQIPCVYCYVENKRQALKDAMHTFMKAKQGVWSTDDEAEARKLMYGQAGTKSNPDRLTKAATDTFTKWRKRRQSDKEEGNYIYSPTMENLHSDYMGSRSYLFALLDKMLADGGITKTDSAKKLTEKIVDACGITENRRYGMRSEDVTFEKAQIEELADEWLYDIIHGEKHRDVKPVDLENRMTSSALMNKNALSLWQCLC